ncbi:NADH dehydrogenase [ubiquinone] 1 alpha subcomplex subunit 13 [Phymastichus coffea]|uniref:NADH dehydrogenase [ubiquinone] 1 alpha subcomplex subunit 13 n=1 Tax=Phymastichus coffea TaxID=108790 RepID=UPI00273C5C6D|nr:NADH dehydrogenase [ubiquinone] 1 alpha subcomplex subunit 13 [Phymastichus coffea]
MASTAKTGPQEMPPAGGYGSIQWKRVPLKTIFTPSLTIGLYVLATTLGTIGYYYSYQKVKRDEIEMRSARNVILALMLAERDRAFLKQCRINRDEERELMKDVPEWEVGTYFREPVYITQPKKFHVPTYWEFNAHADMFEATYRVLRRHFM